MPAITGSVEDREQIRELYARYAFYIDSSKFEEWVNCFTEDGIFESPLARQARRPRGAAQVLRFVPGIMGRRAGASHDGERQL